MRDWTRAQHSALREAANRTIARFMHPDDRTMVMPIDGVAVGLALDEIERLKEEMRSLKGFLSTIDETSLELQTALVEIFGKRT